MRENSKCFILAYSSPLLKISILKEIGLKEEDTVCRELIDTGVKISGITDEVALFLSLLYQPNKSSISYEISLDQWNSH